MLNMFLVVRVGLAAHPLHAKSPILVMLALARLLRRVLLAQAAMAKRPSVTLALPALALTDIVGTLLVTGGKIRHQYTHLGDLNADITYRCTGWSCSANAPCQKPNTCVSGTCASA